VNMVCFDKTGTLSEADLDVFGAVPVAKHPEIDISR
jgi:magnesium-transporting ATPase (P-type)